MEFHDNRMSFRLPNFDNKVAGKAQKRLKIAIFEHFQPLFCQNLVIKNSSNHYETLELTLKTPKKHFSKVSASAKHSFW